MVKLHQNYFIESILFEKVNSNKKKLNPQDHKNIDGIENNLTPFQNYPETKVACKCTTSLYETQYSEILVEYKKSF